MTLKVRLYAVADEFDLGDGLLADGLRLNGFDFAMRAHGEDKLNL